MKTEIVFKYREGGIVSQFTDLSELQKLNLLVHDNNQSDLRKGTLVNINNLNYQIEEVASCFELQSPLIEKQFEDSIKCLDVHLTIFYYVELKS